MHAYTYIYMYICIAYLHIYLQILCIHIMIHQELEEANLGPLLELIQAWWQDESISEEDLRARVVLIYRNGDTNKFENYRPISLLNTLYKLCAAILHIRISDTLDRHLQKTQYGFRKQKHGICNTFN